MAKYKPGLHKKVPLIFQDVSIRGQDRICQLSDVALPRDVRPAHPVFVILGQQITLNVQPHLDNAISASAGQPKQSRFVAVIKAVARLCRRVLPSRTRRRQKRLRSTRKHLLINVSH